jgi:HSP20 family protein
MNETKTCSGESTRPSEIYTPRFDIWETGEAVYLCGDLPGVTVDNLDIRFEDHELTIVGKLESPEVPSDCLLSEYGVGDFQRSFTIGDVVDCERISADLKNGVLTITLPKSSSVKTRRVEVKAG